MSPVAAHGVCLSLVILDFLVRAWRIQWIMKGLGSPLALRDAFVVNAFGDAANALTPMRLGGEPARVAGMMRTGARMTAVLVGITLEAVISRVVLIAVASWLIWRYAPAWWATAGPGLRNSASNAWPWIVLAMVVGILLWRYTQRAVSPATRRLRRPLRRVLVYLRRMPRWPLVASLPLSVIPMATRIAILPVLVLTLPSPPPMGPVVFGSFALLYSQMVLPTPSGAGVVELGFLGGAAGPLGEGQGWILLAWRFYTNGLGMLVGVWLALSIYGWPVLRRVLRGKAVPLTEQPDA
ncbi:MAG TPA: lysylphosphatidylglycerol synthase transmembrane domain-containing protein [Gemmatimonadales bacterium]|nr:lysylphosphatidylglycerol synthase transmembrane domain-containing protein [Gemmatimonadales bacterium]